MALNAVNDVVSFLDSSGKLRESDGPVPGATSSTPLISQDRAPIPVAPYQQITIAAAQSVQSLTVPSGATTALIQNNTTAVLRWRDDGSNPTISTGLRINAGDELPYNGSLAAFKLIAEATGTGTIDINYYR